MFREREPWVSGKETACETEGSVRKLSLNGDLLLLQQNNLYISYTTADFKPHVNSMYFALFAIINYNAI